MTTVSGVSSNSIDTRSTSASSTTGRTGTGLSTSRNGYAAKS